MCKIFCITNTDSTGGTFLNWSVHWLSGEKLFYNVDLNWIPLTTDPIRTTLKHHNHKKNYAAGYVEIVSMINKLKTIKTDNVLSIYADSISLQDTLKNLKIPKHKINHYLIDEYRKDDMSKIWSFCFSNNVPMIYLKLTSPRIYQTEIKTLKKPFSDGYYNDIDEAQNEFFSLYYPGSSRWLNAPVWEKREWVALNLRLFNNNDIYAKVNFTLPHLYLDSQELWFNGEGVLEKIMNYLNISIDSKRLKSWIPIYYHWQKLQSTTLKFLWNIDYICDAIVNNFYYDLSEYNLDLWHEAVILHILLYRYQLNLKSWQMEKFPSNTQDLHKLLESNIIHKLDNTYKLL